MVVVEELATENGGAILFELRHRSGLSQSRLSAVSGVSVRTIRAIENGKNRAPHESTLRALAGGMRLNETDTHRLLGVSENIRSLRTFSELVDDGVDLATAMSELSVRNLNAHRLVSRLRHARVADTRRVRCLEDVTVIEAIRDGVDHHLVFQSGDQSIDARLIQMETLDGCSLAARHHFAEWNAVLFELSIGEPLTAGETRVLRFRLDMGGSPSEDDAELARIWHSLEDSDGLTDSFSRTVAMHTFVVTFEGTLPSRVWELRGIQDVEEVGDLALDKWNSAHVFGQNREPGNYGIGWSWE